MSLIREVNEMGLSSNDKMRLVSAAREELGKNVSTNDIAEWFGMALENLPGMETIDPEGIINELVNMYVDLYS